MKTLSLAFILLLLPMALPAEELLSDVYFADAPKTVSSTSGEQSHVLLTLPDPGISSSVHALKGMVRYDDLQGEGFLQMDSQLGDAGVFFTKSLAPAGTLGKLSGSSDWRPFVLPFTSDGSKQVDKLTLLLVLPGAGTVSIKDVGLYQYASGEDPLQASGQWFDARSAGLLGGIGGALIGLWGALIGVLASRGKARPFVFTSVNALLTIGIASLVGGAVAFVTGQPYAVYYTLLLFGILIVVVFGKMRGSLSAKYEQIELMKMRSMDV